MTTSEIKEKIMERYEFEGKPIEGFILEYKDEGWGSVYTLGTKNIGFTIFSDKEGLRNVIYFKATKRGLKTISYWD